MSKVIRVMNKKRILSTRWFDLMKKNVSFPGKSTRENFYSIKQKDYVTIIAQTNKKEIILVKQYRPVLEIFTIELPSGHVNKNELPFKAAIRELKEETGFIVSKPTLLGCLSADTGRLENKLWAFYAASARLDRAYDLPEKKLIKTYLVSPKKLLSMVKRGKFSHALDLSVMTLAYAKGKLKI